MDSPLIAAIAAKMVEQIEHGLLPAGRHLPSERELAADFGASRGVIRAAIKELASRGLIEVKPRCRPAVLAFNSNLAPRKVGKPNIGIWLWPHTGDYAAATILKGIQSVDLGQEINLVVANAVGGDWDSIFDSEARFLRTVAEDPQSAGAILWYLGGHRNIAALCELRKQGVPLVFVDRLPPDEFAADFVGTDNEAAAHRAIRHLIQLGHRRIAIISNIEAVSSVRERESGYLRALKEAGLPVCAEYIQHDPVDDARGVDSVLDAWLDLAEPPTAIFGVNDHIALQICDALRDRGISVPHQMSVIGFDGLLRWVPGGGYLTTLMQDFERIGRLAAEIVAQRMESGPTTVFRHFMLDAPILDRGSTAEPRKKNRPLQRDPNS